jgi:hypothetical protein
MAYDPVLRSERAKTQIIVLVPDAQSRADFPAALTELLYLLGLNEQDTRWTMPGTRVHNNQRAVLTQMDCSLALAQWIFPKVQADYPLDWTFVAAQRFELIPITNEQTGEVTGYSGIYKPVPATFVDWLEDVDDQGTRPEAGAALSKYAGAADWLWAAP